MNNTPRSRVPAGRLFVPWGKKQCAGWYENENGCHIWVGGRNASGYARTKVGGKGTYVYRVRYEQEVGPVPPEHDLDHYVCDNGAGGCCNPHHCRPATRRENALRSNSPSAMNASKTHCKHGHELSGDNLMRTYLRIGKRICRTCHAAIQRAYEQRRKSTTTTGAAKTYNGTAE